MKSLYLYQLILFGLIIDPLHPPPPPKKRKETIKIPQTHTQTKHPQQMQNVHLKVTLRLRLIKKGGFIKRYMTAN